MHEADVAYIALGSNLGDRAAHLARARAALAALPASRVLAESEIEETAPIGPAGQRPYLNQMVALETTLAPNPDSARRATTAGSGFALSEYWRIQGSGNSAPSSPARRSSTRRSVT